MPIKTILAPMPDAQAAAPTLATVFALAGTFGAHARVLHVRPDPTEAVADFVGETMSASLVEEVVEASERRAASVAGKVRKAFDDAVAKAKIQFSSKPAAGGKASADYLEEVGYAESRIETLGRVSDLIVARRPRSDTDVVARTVVETALLGTGRPVLLVPTGRPGSIGGSVAIAWNGSIEAATAVDAAMPFIRRAKSVTAIAVTEGDATLNIDGLVEYLRFHGVRAKRNLIKTRSSDIGKAVTGAAARAKADLLVMGAYTHSRVREMILGGVTDHVLSSSRTAVLLVH